MMRKRNSQTVVADIEGSKPQIEDFFLSEPRSKTQNEIKKRSSTAISTSNPVVATLPRAEHTGELNLDNVVIPCAVLDDGTRVLTQQGFNVAIGRNRKPNKGQAALDDRPSFLSAKNLDPFISEELRTFWTPIRFVPKSGGGHEGAAFGYRAELLPKVCYVFLDAQEAKKILPSQFHVVEQCRIIVRAFATVGIIALIDECTGYQEVRDRKALQKILDRYILDEWRAWSRQFPTEFYRQLFRLRGWTFDELSNKRPGVLSHYTKDIVYSRLAPGVLKELQTRVPRNEKGKPTEKLHQGLTPEYGVPALREHIHASTALMRASSTWNGFYRLLQRSFPKFDGTIPLPFLDEEEID
jgi:hypothetical protein